MSPGQRRTALISILAAVVLVALKLGTGLFTGSLALVSAGVESSGDVVAAILTFLAVRLGARPADSNHPYGHRRVENLAALGEAAIIGLGGLIASYEAIRRLTSGEGAPFEVAWYLFAILAVAITIDVSRIVVSLRAARRYNSAAFRSNAFNFAGDLAGSLSALAGILLVGAGFEQGDSIAALLVAALIFVAVGRLVLENGHVLMDKAPEEGRRLAEQGVTSLAPHVELRGIRLRESGRRYFVEVTVAVQATQTVAEGHKQADRVEEAVQRELPDADVVVHVEPSPPLAAPD